MKKYWLIIFTLTIVTAIFADSNRYEVVVYGEDFNLELLTGLITTVLCLPIIGIFTILAELRKCLVDGRPVSFRNLYWWLI